MVSVKAWRRSGARPWVCAMAASSAAVLLGLEPLVAVADGLFIEALASLEGADVVGDELALVNELGVGLDEADELLAVHRLPAGRLLRVAGEQGHDVVVIDDGGSEEDELEVELLHHGAERFVAAFALLFLQALSGLEINAAEGVKIVPGQNLLDGLFLFFGEVGVLIELGLEPLDFLEASTNGRGLRRP